MNYVTPLSYDMGMEECAPDWIAMPTVAMAEELVERHRRLTASEAEFLAGLAVFDRRLGWQVLGYRSAAKWLARTMGMTMVTARDKLRVARTLADGLPAVGAAFADGSISYAAARAISRLPDADANTERALVAAARSGVSVGQLEALVRRAKDAVDPDAANADAERDFDRRGLYMTRGMAGSVLGEFELDAEAGELLLMAIDSVLASERAHGNPVVPRPVDSCESTGLPTATPAQRRVDGLMALIRAGLDSFESTQPGRARSEVAVIVDYSTLVERTAGTAQTSSGAPLTAEQVRRLCCDANLRRIVTKGGSELLDVGTRTPSFTAAQRCAMYARDRGCRFPGCGRWFGLHPHHLMSVADGGPTSTDNGAWHCTTHHHLVHEGGWTITGHPDHTLRYQPPDGSAPLPSTPPAAHPDAA